MIDIIVIAIVVALSGAALGYVIKSKKRGAKCIGCPVSACSGKCSGCSGGAEASCCEKK